MATLHELRNNFAKKTPKVAGHVVWSHTALLQANARFDVISEGREGKNFHVVDLRLKFGQHKGQTLREVALVDRPYLRELHQKAVVQLELKEAFQKTIQLVLGESAKELGDKHALLDK